MKRARLIMEAAIKRYYPNLSSEQKEELWQAILDDYEDGGLGKITIRDVVEIAQASGIGEDDNLEESVKAKTVNKLIESLEKLSGQKVKLKESSLPRKFEVEIEVYERFNQGAKKKVKGTAIDLYDLCKKLDQKGYDIDYYLDLEENKGLTDEEVISQLDGNGDGGSYYTIYEILPSGERKLLVGGDNYEDDDL